MNTYRVVYDMIDPQHPLSSVRIRKCIGMVGGLDRIKDGFWVTRDGEDAQYGGNVYFILPHMITLIEKLS